MKKGDAVQQIVHPIRGEVVEKRFDEIADAFSLCVEYTDAQGNPVRTWFWEDQLELA